MVSPIPYCSGASPRGTLPRAKKHSPGMFFTSLRSVDLLRCPVNVLGASAFVPHRPRPLAQLPVSATGGGRIAPLSSPIT